jgi:RHS repeat-associated protein
MKIIQIAILAIAATFLAATDSQAKYCDDETDLVYYGYRYYNPTAGRWLSRDPMAEPGFAHTKNPPSAQELDNSEEFNCYTYVVNAPIVEVDYLGLAPCTPAMTASCKASCSKKGLIYHGCNYIIDIPLVFWTCSVYRCTCCDPCVPGVGSIAYRSRSSGRSHAGVSPPLSIQYVMNQNPLNCQCFWSQTGVTLPGIVPPPIVPAGGGGF